MLRSVTTTIAALALGLIAGSMFPAMVAYSILFVRRNGRHFKTVLRLVGRVFLIILIFGLIFDAFIFLPRMFGGSETDILGPYYLIGFGVSFIGSIVGLVIGARRGRKRQVVSSS